MKSRDAKVRVATRLMMTSVLALSVVSVGCDDSKSSATGTGGTTGAAGAAGTGGNGSVTVDKDIVDTAVAAGSFTTLAAALTAADLVPS